MAAAVKDILIPAGIAAFVALCAIAAGVQAGKRRLDEAQHASPSFREQVLMDAIRRGELREGHHNDGSAP
jgi:hypothetical protein